MSLFDGEPEGSRAPRRVVLLTRFGERGSKLQLKTS
jgi:hypothetical protein